MDELDPKGAPRFDLERIIPELLSSENPLERTTLLTHLQRYEFASGHVRARRVLDLACGVGYGSALLAKAGAAEVLGADLSSEAIAHAKRTYASENLSFVCADAFEFTPPAPFDVVVSLETIEHVADPARLFRRLVEMVAPGGMLIASVPTTLSSDVNPYHLSDFTEAQFRRMFQDAGLEIVDELRQRQRVSLRNLLRIRTGSSRSYQLRSNLVGYYLRHPRMAMGRALQTLRTGLDNRYLVIAGRRAGATRG
ncbi:MULTISPECIES: bifunctional 2-polyprenyl-6-hydroxyphenol methylase/3-demethylubiquinol 3-O-methyltransferase UbiG [Myxococcaceae]|uniref:class I SAM-dependent methyltransferase n=1 Tax=Myxococcaceae TaxID=31 RepID=UPI00188E2711|nr:MULTISPECIES: class I SAM-dependent methyltransferase [Myxococcaceae]MBF5044742.1 class I SAM-dependent methyltransferase [Simulacricoccus sp. 17bor-14]